MIVKGIVLEDFVNYKKPSMFVVFPSCTFKCERECGGKRCQNRELIKEANISIKEKDIVEAYMKNEISKALVCGGLEPFDTFSDLYALVREFCVACNDDVVIYTGYNKEEISPLITYISLLGEEMGNKIIIKYGRYIPNKKSQYDEILGVDLASDNQYSEIICGGKDGH